MKTVVCFCVHCSRLGEHGTDATHKHVICRYCGKDFDMPADIELEGIEEPEVAIDT